MIDLSLPVCRDAVRIVSRFCPGHVWTYSECSMVLFRPKASKTALTPCVHVSTTPSSTGCTTGVGMLFCRTAAMVSSISCSARAQIMSRCAGASIWNVIVTFGRSLMTGWISAGNSTFTRCCSDCCPTQCKSDHRRPFLYWFHPGAECRRRDFLNDWNVRRVVMDQDLPRLVRGYQIRWIHIVRAALMMGMEIDTSGEIVRRPSTEPSAP